MGISVRMRLIEVKLPSFTKTMGPWESGRCACFCMKAVSVECMHASVSIAVGARASLNEYGVFFKKKLIGVSVPKECDPKAFKFHRRFRNLVVGQDDRVLLISRCCSVWQQLDTGFSF